MSATRPGHLLPSKSVIGATVVAIGLGAIYVGTQLFTCP